MRDLRCKETIKVLPLVGGARYKVLGISGWMQDLRCKETIKVLEVPQVTHPLEDHRVR